MEPSGGSREVSAYKRIEADRTEDWIPLVSTVTNFIDLHEKYMWKGMSPEEKDKVDPIKRKYYSYLETKSVGKCLLLAIPGVNLIVKLYDYYMKGSLTYEKSREDEVRESPELADSYLWEAARQGNFKAWDRIKGQPPELRSEGDDIEFLEITVNKISSEDLGDPSAKYDHEIRLANLLLLKGKTKEARDHYQNVIRNRDNVGFDLLLELEKYEKVWDGYSLEKIAAVIQMEKDRQERIPPEEQTDIVGKVFDEFFKELLLWEAARKGDSNAMLDLLKIAERDDGTSAITKPFHYKSEELAELYQIVLDKGDPNVLGGPQEMGGAEIGLGDELMLLGKYEEALKHYANVVNKFGVDDPDLPEYIKVYKNIVEYYSDKLVPLEIILKRRLPDQSILDVFRENVESRAKLQRSLGL